MDGSVTWRVPRVGGLGYEPIDDGIISQAVMFDDYRY